MGKKSAVLFAALIVIPLSGFAEDITLVKHARRVESLETARYTVEKGDTLWKIFLRSFEANTEDMPYLYKKFRELNPRVKNLDHIIAGQRIIIPRVPDSGKEHSVKAASQDIYVIKQGQHLAMVLREIYGLPDKLIFNEYLNLIKEMNPEIEDINRVEPGQTIKMPKVDAIVSAVETLEKKQARVVELMPAKPIETKKAQIVDIAETPEKELVDEIVSKEPEPVEKPPIETKKVMIEDISEAEVEDMLDHAVSMKTEPMAELKPQEEPVKAASVQVLKTEEKKLTKKEILEKPHVVSPLREKEKTTAAKVAQSEKQEELKQDKGRPEVVAVKKVNREDTKTQEQQVKSVSAGESANPVTKDTEKPLIGESTKKGTGGGTYTEGEKRQLATRLVRNTLMPALTSMGGRTKDKGTYFMPMSGGSSISIDTSEIPVMELDTGRRIILDVNNKISKQIKDLLEKTFPLCSIISGPSENMEGLMDRVLNVSGYFSINKDASPLLVGEEEKVRFSGKWIVYKDYSRHNVFVVNILSDQEERTPATIQQYASRFGIDLIELGGIQNDTGYVESHDIRKLEHSYGKLFDELGIAYETDKVLDLVVLGAVKITYKAPIITGSTILAKNLPEETMLDLLRGKNYTVIHTAKTSLEEILKALGQDLEGPPVKVVVAQRRTELELPALKVRDTIILQRSIDRDIGAYLASRGRHVLMW